MNPERSTGHNVVTPDLIRDYMGWWTYLAVMGGFAPIVGPVRQAGGFDVGEAADRMRGQHLVRDNRADVAITRDGLVG
jgi:hypothetical protein